MREFSKKLLSLLLVVAMIVPMCGMMFTVGAEDKSSIKVGDTITLGTYPQSAIKDADGKVTGYKTEPIEWLVLRIDNGKALLLSKEILDGKAYNHTSATVNGYYGNNYAHSDIRKWLIGDFYNTAFSDNDKNAVVPTVLDNSATNSTYSSESTTDNVFLLSKWEAETYASNYYSTTATDYACIENNTETDYLGNHSWLTRTARSNYYQFFYVQYRSGWTIYYNWYDDRINVSIGVRPAITVDLDKYEESVKKTPSGYDFFKDSYNFGNPEEKISVEYFKTMYEDSSGKAMGEALYNEKENRGKHGICFGMTYTTASIYNGLPSANRFTGVLSNPKNIRDLRKSHKFSVGDYELSLMDFIKYSYVYHYSSELSYMNNTKNDIDGLINITKDYVENDRIGICLDLYHCIKDKNDKWVAESGHSVLVVGIDGNDILIDDPNFTKELQRLKVNDDGSWEYSGAWREDGVSSENSSFCYGVSYFRPYQMLKTGTTTTVRDGVLSDNSSDTASETYVDDMQRLDSDHTLITITGSVEITGTDIVAPISSTNLSASFSNTTNNDDIIGYWVEDANEITIENTSGGENDIQYAKDNLLVSTESTNFSSITVADNTVLMNTTKNSKVSLTIETVYTYEDFGTTINGTASGEQVTVSKTKDGYTVIGLKDMKITHLKNDEEVDHTDVDHDGTCDICSTNLTANCTCACHSNAFIKLIYKIIAFILSLFGSSFDCACGMSHR